MNDDIEYCPGRSIAELPITSILHRPCPDLAGLVDYDPKKTQRALALIGRLRKKHGIKRRVKRNPKPMTYVCTTQGCIESWDLKTKPNPRGAHEPTSSR